MEDLADVFQYVGFRQLVCRAIFKKLGTATPPVSACIAINEESRYAAKVADIIGALMLSWTTREKSIAPRRYATIDAWRGIACVLVVVFHSVFNKDQDTASHGLIEYIIHQVSKRGWIGVPIFFVISGYCITAAVERSIARGEGIGEFAKRRFQRIYPPAWACLGISIFLISIVDTLVCPRILSSNGVFMRPWWLDITQWLGNLTLTETWRHHLAGNPSKYVYLGHYWTLCYEEQFYAVMGFLMLFFRKRFYTSVAMMTTATVGANWLLNGWGISTTGYFFDGQWLIFAMGVLVYFSLHRASRIICTISGMILAGVAAYAMLSLDLLLQDERSSSQSHFVAAVFSVVLLSCFRWDEQVSKNRLIRVFSFLGVICFSLYLTHLPVIGILQGLLLWVGIRPSELSPVLTIPACLILSLAVALPFHKYVELRFMSAPRPV